MNHASWVNNKRSEARVKAAKDAKEQEVKPGKRLEDMNSDEQMAYYGYGDL